MHNNSTSEQLERLQTLMPELFTSDGKLSLSQLEMHIGKENIYSEESSIPEDQCITEIQPDQILREKAIRQRDFWLSESQRIGKIGSFSYRINQGVWKSSGVLDEILGIKNKVEKTLEDWLELIHPDDQKSVIEYFSQVVLHKNKSFSKEYRILRKEGEIIWVRSMGNLILQKDEQPEKIMGTIQDITEQKWVELTLRKKEALQDKMFANIGDVVVIIDKDGINRYKSPNIEKWFGWKPEELIGQSSWENIHPDDQEQNKAFFGALFMHPNASGIITCRYRRKDNSYRWVEFTGVNLMHDPDINGILGNYHEITERKQAEDKLRYVARIYALLSQINKAIIQNREEHKLFHTICKIAIETGQFRMAWIGLFDETENLLKPATYAGYDDGYLEQVLIIPGDETTGKGPSGLALQEGKIINCYDIATHPGMLPWREEALKRGYLSSVAVPFKRKGKVVGTLNLYASEIGFFTTKEQLLLQEIGDNISFALNAIDTEMEHKRAEEALEKSEAHFRSITETATDAILTVDPKGIITYINHATEMLLGYEQYEVIGQSISIMIPHMHRANHDDKVKSFFEHKEHESIGKQIELFCLTKDHREIPIELKLSKWEIKETQFVTVIIRDISERLRLERQYKILFNQMLDGFALHEMIYDKENRPVDYRFLAVNPAFETHTGLKSHDILGKTILEILPNTEKVWIETYGEVAQTGKPIKFEEYSSQIGKYFQVAAFSGAPNQFATILTDITAHKQAEKILKENHLQLEKKVKERTTELERILGINRAIVDNAGIAMISSDKQGCIRSINPYAERLIGFKYEEIIGKSITAFFRKKEKEVIFGKSDRNTYITARRHLQNIISNQNIVRETYILSQSGVITPVLLSITILRNSKGKIDGFVGVATDISSRKKAEDALNKSQQELQLREIYLSSIIQNHPGRFWMKDNDGKFLFSNHTNDKFVRLTQGVDDSGIIGKKESDFRTIQDAQIVIKQDHEVISKKKVLILEEQIKIGAKDFWYEKLKFPVIDQKGQTIGVAGYAMDITHRKEQDAQLRMQSEAFESFALSIVITDNEGRIQWANPAFQKLTGYTPKEVIGKNPRLLSLHYS